MAPLWPTVVHHLPSVVTNRVGVLAMWRNLVGCKVLSGRGSKQHPCKEFIASLNHWPNIAHCYPSTSLWNKRNIMSVHLDRWLYGPICLHPRSVVILNVSNRHGRGQRGRVTQAQIVNLKSFGGTALHVWPSKHESRNIWFDRNLERRLRNKGRDWLQFGRLVLRNNIIC